MEHGGAMSDIVACYLELRAAGYEPRVGELTVNADDPDDRRRIHDICDGYMVEVLQHPGSSRLTVREVKP